MTVFETTFEVRCTPAQAWAALESAQPANLALEPARRWWLPGFESTGVEVEVEPGERLTLRKDAMPCEGTTIAVTFEHLPTGARISVVQSGFDDSFVESAGEAFWAHAATIADGFRSFFEQVEVEIAR